MVYVKRVINIICFLAGLLLLLILSSLIVRPKNNSPEAGMEEAEANGILGEPENSIDILFIGDSQAYCGFIPLTLWNSKGYTSYVCATSGQSLDYTWIMLRRAFEKQSPKYVVLETNTLYKDIARKNILGRELGSLLPVFDYHDRWKNITAKDFYEPVDYTWTSELKGYKCLVSKRVPDNTDYMGSAEGMQPIIDNNRNMLERIKAYCEEHGARLILVSVPSTKNWSYKKHNGVYKLAGELQCDYIDFNLPDSFMEIDWNNDTCDGGDHLNYYGALKVTAYMGEYFEGLGGLQDKRGMEAYGEWDRCYEKFMEQ